MPFYGAPLQIPNRSLQSVLIVEPTLGIDASQPSVDAPLGSTPSSDNYLMREGGLEPRPMLTLRGTNPQPMGNVPILGGWEIADVTNIRYPLISGTTRLAWYSTGSWGVLSYVSAGGVNSPPAGSTTSWWDGTQIYYDLRDQNLAILANGSYQSLYCWEANTTVFSTLTGAPMAKTVTAYDNYLVAFNLRDPSSTSEYVQRVQWNDRGSASSWTGGLSGFEDLLDMRGQGTRIMAQENRLILFSDAEIWQGVTSDFPFVFRFAPLDRSVGCPYPFTATGTPQGIVFLSRDLQPYLLPKSGGQAVPIGRRLHRTLRQEIDIPERAWATYDPATEQYQLYYPVRGGSGRPQHAMYLDLGDGSWAPQSFDRVGGALSLTRGFPVTGTATSSSATSWGGLQAAGVRWADLGMSWAALGGLTTSQDARSVWAGSSAGTMYEFSSTATSDNGTPVESRWRSTGLLGGEPGYQHTVTELRIDYQADSASSLTVRFSQTAGASFEPGRQLNLPAASGLSQAIDYPYLPARYPMVEVTSEAQRYRLFRLYIQMRRGGR